MAILRCCMISLVISLLFVQGIQVASGNLQCEELPVEDCAFAVSSSGARCVLEKYIRKDGGTRVECQTSIIMAGKHVEYIETEECIQACGLERMSFGLSTDSLLENEFTEKLCSASCQDKCDNIVDLYTNLVAGEGVYLPQLCTAQKIRDTQSYTSNDVKLVAQAPSSPSDKGTAQGVGGAKPWTVPAGAPTPL